MLTLIAAMAVVLGLSILLFAYLGYKNYQRWQLNNQLADELDVILKATLKNLKDIKERHAAEGAAPLIDLKDPLKAITSPAMISTMLTVLVKKNKIVRLSLEDFSNLGDEDFISIYVDNKTQQLVLSTRHDLADGAESLLMSGFTSNDDNTFH
jgi:hypothetical protein